MAKSKQKTHKASSKVLTKKKTMLHLFLVELLKSAIK